MDSFLLSELKMLFRSFARICSQVLGKNVFSHLISSPCPWIFIVLDKKVLLLISQNSFHKSVVLGGRAG